MGAGEALSSIDPATGWVMFDSFTGAVMFMDPLDKIDEEVARMLLNELKGVTIAAVDAAYAAKGYVPAGSGGV